VRSIPTRRTTLIAVESQDGAGMTNLLHATFLELERRKLPVMAVPEFSDSPIGLRLLDALARDKFLRQPNS
jgi:thymidylate kinase